MKLPAFPFSALGFVNLPGCFVFIFFIGLATQASLAQPVPDSTLFSEEPAKKGKLALKSPIFVENQRLKLNFQLPGREGIKFTFPKLIYAGSTPPFDPNVSYQRSLIIPGWGQYYNRSKWKIPIIYAGYGGIAYLISTSHNQYKDYQRAYRIRIETGRGIAVSAADSFFIENADPRIAAADSNGLLAVRDQRRSSRDRYILLGIGYHLFWVLEAYVNAHLKGLDVSEDLSIRLHPNFMGIRRRDRKTIWAAGATLTVDF